MASTGGFLRWLLCVVILLSVAGAAPGGRSAGFHGKLGGGHRDRYRHGCRFDWNAAKTLRLGSHGLRRFIAEHAGRMSELCRSAAHVSGSPCDCRPSWQCPYQVTGPDGRTCRLPGHGIGYCCRQPQADVTSARSSFGVTIVSSVGPAVVTSVVPAPVVHTQVTTTTYTFHYTTTTTTTTTTSPPPSTTASTPRPSLCRPLVQCPVAVVDPLALAVCRLQDGSLGVVCEDPIPAGPGSATRAFSGVDGGRRAFVGDGVVSEQFVVSSTGGGGGDTMTEAARAEAEQAVQAQAAQDAALNSPTRAVRTFNLNFQSSPEDQQQGLQGLQHLLAVAALQRQMEGSGTAPQLVSQPAAPGSDSSSFPASAAFASAGSAPGQSATAQPQPQPLRIPGCEPEPQPVCEPGLYRTPNGECNNLQRPRQGSAKTGFKRLFASTYEDGVLAIRSTSVKGQPLPSARLISERIVETFSRELSGFTLSVMQWGQFIDHDLDHAMIFQARGDGGGAIECCLKGGRIFPVTPLHPQCIPIEIPAYDPFYSQFGQRCMSQVRSLPAPEPDCIARPATPTNTLTAYLDAGNIYGNSMAQQNELRALSGGLLRTSPGQLLPFAGADGDCVEGAEICYTAGDSRVNEQGGLTVMHTLFTREHNRVATALRRRHPFWDDERLFQGARRVVMAEWQHIIYNEWLPIVVGFDYARDHDLLPLQSGRSFEYQPQLDASISNEFATAAFRFGHSMVREMYDLINAQGAVTRTVNIISTFFNPTVVAEALVEIARALVDSRSEAFDTNVVSSLHERLFASPSEPGLDLIALNIQRGRDHGIPTYTTVLRACTGITVTSWSDLSAVIDQPAIHKLRSVYADTRDVDLFIGGLSERRAPGAQVGPTFQCLIGQQFFDVRYGDRFFYDVGGMVHSFSKEQLDEIRKSSWARILCDTLGAEFDGDFSQVQPLAFLEPGIPPNFVVTCNSHAIPRVNLAVF